MYPVVTMIDPVTALGRLLVAVFVGLLIGLDRERAETRKRFQVFAGVRTFPLIALAGALPMLVIDVTGAGLLVASFVAVAAIGLVSYIRASGAGGIGATTEIAALATFLLGVLAGAGQLVVAGAAGVGVAVLLVAKPRLEAFSRALTEEELTAALELAVISVIVLPLVPNRGYGPWQVWNPFEIWLVVVLVSGLSFAGFIAMRLFGERRGIILTGVLGALVSSTAATVSLASRSRQAMALAAVTATATVLASTIMCVRVAILVGAVNAGVLTRLLPVIGAMLLEGAGAALLLSKKGPAGGDEASGTPMANPFSLVSALTFGAIYTVILVAARAGHEYFGTQGIYVAAALGALADVDASAIAFSRLAVAGISPQVAAIALTIAVVTNTIVKMAIAIVMGGVRFRAYVATSLAVMAVVGALTGVLLFY